MSLQQTLERVDLDIKNGNLGKARERLLGLLVSFPDDLSLRKRLGDIFWKLQYPGMAGKYWYLEEEKTTEMELACGILEKQNGNDPLHILLALKFRGDIQTIENDYAGKVLLDLHKCSKERHPNGVYFDFRKKGKSKFYSHDKHERKNISIGCIIITLLAFSMMVIGLIAVVIWIIQLVK